MDDTAPAADSLAGFHRVALGLGIQIALVVIPVGILPPRKIPAHFQVERDGDVCLLFIVGRLGNGQGGAPQCRGRQKLPAMQKMLLGIHDILRSGEPGVGPRLSVCSGYFPSTGAYAPPARQFSFIQYAPCRRCPSMAPGSITRTPARARRPSSSRTACFAIRTCSITRWRPSKIAIA